MSLSGIEKIGLTIVGTVAGFVTGGPTGAAWGFNIAQGVIEYDSYRLQKKMQSQSTASKQQGIQTNVTSTAGSMPIIYGETKVGVKIVDIRQDPSDVDILAIVGAFAVAPDGGNATAQQGIQGVARVYFDEKLAITGPTIGANDASDNPRSDGVQSWLGTAGGTFGGNLWCEYMIHDGDDSQTYDYKLNDTFSSSGTASGAWGTQTRGTGIAYIVLWLHYKDDVFVNGIPQVTLRVQGNKVADCEDLTADVAYSTNPANCIYDFMTSKRYGMGIPRYMMDAGTSSSSFKVAKDHCDESVTVSGPGDLTNRYTCNGFLDSSASPMENLQQLLTSCQGRIVVSDGKYRLIQRKATSAETFELNTDNIVGQWSFARAGIEDTANIVNAKFVDLAQNYQPMDITWPQPVNDNPYLTLDAGFKNELNIELPFTKDAYMAHMIAAQTMLETRADITCTVVCQREALKLEVGQVVNVNHPTPNFTDKTFWVEQIRVRPDGLVQLALKEYVAATYTVPVAELKVAMVTHDTPGRYADDVDPDPQS